MEIQSGVNDNLVVTVDGIEYDITIPAGEYDTSHELFTSELTTVINSQLASIGAPFTVRIGGIHDDDPRTTLVLEHNDLDLHFFEDISGSAVSTIVGDVYQIDNFGEPPSPTPTDPTPQDSTPQEPTPATPTP